MPKLAKDTISKNLIISQVFLEKIFELSLYHWVFGFKATFIVILLLNYHSVRK